MLIIFRENKPFETVTSNSKIEIVEINTKIVDKLKKLPKFLYLFYAFTRILFQIFQLFFIFLCKIQTPELVIVQVILHKPTFS